jgi:hypothetical protein
MDRDFSSCHYTRVTIRIVEQAETRMRSDYPQKGIEKRRRRAAKLGVDDLICNLFFDAGLQNYTSWSQDPNWACPSISEVHGSQRGSLGFTLKGRRYSIHAEEDHLHSPSHPGTTQINLELLLGGNLVFGGAIEHQAVENLETYSPRSVSEFIEGDWVEDLRDLEREMKQVAKRNLKRIKRERAQTAAGGIGLSTAERSGSGPGALRKIWRRIVSGCP